MFIAIAILCGVAAGGVILEVRARRAGWGAWRQLQVQDNAPTMHQPDPILGWKPIPGRHVIAPYSRGTGPVQMTFLPDGTRATGGMTEGRPTLLFVGCSFTQGRGVSDHETFAWRLQERYPSLRVLNGGVGAYGTYQSLLVMERWLAQPDPPALVFYGLIEEHEPRNVAVSQWLMLLAAASRTGMVASPYCTVDANGALIRHPPEAYPRWPLREYSALITFLQRSYFESHAGDRMRQQRAVTEQLLLEMQRTAQRHRTRFCVVLLHFSSAKAHYAAFLAKHGIEYVDCDFPITSDMRVPNDAHPNGAMHARYAECIAAKIEAGGFAKTD